MLLRVHHDRAVPRHRLLERLARDQEEPHAVVAGLHRDLVAAVEEHERAVVRPRGRLRVRPADAFGRHRQRAGGVAELRVAREDIGERMPRGLDREGLPLARRDRHIEVDRVGRDPVHGALRPPEAPADDANVGAVVVGDRGNLGRLHLLIAGRRHLQRRRQVRPQLEPVHPAGRVALGHLLVDDAAAGRHPLDVAGVDGAAVPHAVAVLDGPREDVRDRLDAAVGVPGEAGQVILGDVVAEVVEQQERVEVRGVPEAERAAKMHARAFEGRLGLDEPFDGSDGHLGSSSFLMCHGGRQDESRFEE